MNIKITLATALTLFFINASAQKKYTYLFKYTGQKVTNLDSADFIREVSEPDPGTMLYNITEYYKNGVKKMNGKSSRPDVMVLEGQSTSYFESGVKREETNFINGKKQGDSYEYFPNGKLYTQRKYLPSTDFQVKVVIIANNDSTGKQLLTNGDGYYIGYDYNFTEIIEQGTVSSGVRNGEWKGVNGDKRKITFTEQYEFGNLISGRSVDKDNNTYNYTVRQVFPTYVNGMQEFYKFLSQNIKYPPNAFNSKTQGKVYVSFIVESDGSLNELKAIRSPDMDLSAEAIRILRMSPKWIPGKMYGVPIRVSYTVPINFSL